MGPQTLNPIATTRALSFLYLLSDLFCKDADLATALRQTNSNSSFVRRPLQTNTPNSVSSMFWQPQSRKIIVLLSQAFKAGEKPIRVALKRCIHGRIDLHARKFAISAKYNVFLFEVFWSKILNCCTMGKRLYSLCEQLCKLVPCINQNFPT
jgi:hypothetical protein